MVLIITAIIALIYGGVITVPHPVLSHVLFHLILVTNVDVNYVNYVVILSYQMSTGKLGAFKEFA